MFAIAISTKHLTRAEVVREMNKGIYRSGPGPSGRPLTRPSRSAEPAVSISGDGTFLMTCLEVERV
jgi:hypothetical protein